ncbi:hypothetical protein FCI23_32825 [Actinacidiphila oryziradicis]|uniref:Uncharacterized protein n=1 Tax=Actinacidiphila oryziradicis TaxID=2571141 RepID=A0A4U0SDC1_9ACTN|nr:hypothetical protein FCI23_32825 [Actinacidiphila oryziradicis]
MAFEARGLVSQVTDAQSDEDPYGPGAGCGRCSHPRSLHSRYKRGAFYPFAPLPGEKRDNALELQVKALVTNDLRVEEDLSRWFPVWGAPGL